MENLENSENSAPETLLVSRDLRRRRVRFCVGAVLAGAIFWSFRYADDFFAAQSGERPWRVARRIEMKNATAAHIVAGAKNEIGAIYDASYQPISYPNGDISRTRNGQKQGACSDVVVRALRFAHFDLQRAIHEDMTRNFAIYPHNWDLKAPNASIDHRRVPNQMKFFDRFGEILPLEFTRNTRRSWQPGDIICWNTGNGRTHTGVLSDGVDESDVPLVIHNNSVCREDDCLQRWKIIGHYRFP